MPRSSWKGYLKLSLVSCPIALYNATSSGERVAFNTLSRKSGNRLKQLLVDPATEQPVDPSDRVKGYQFTKGQYIIVEEEDLEALKLKSSKTVEIETFVPASEIDPVYFDSFYYIAPDDRVAEEAFAVIREAMERKKMVGIGRIVLSRREKMMMLQPRGNGMLGTTLRFAYEVKQDSEVFAPISVFKHGDEMIDMAEMIIDRKSGHFEPEKFTDGYEEAVVALIKAKQTGEPFSVVESAGPTPVINIMDALRRSLEADGGAAIVTRRPKAPSKRPAVTDEAHKPKRKASR